MTQEKEYVIDISDTDMAQELNAILEHNPKLAWADWLIVEAFMWAGYACVELSNTR